ncbi:hypothetical protein [Hoeflea sp.]|uniref:hypothetical protein n=1 Tax=Hoeflea sp. TaxID=1940281 RepID=UPI0031B84E8A
MLFVLVQRRSLEPGACATLEPKLPSFRNRYRGAVRNVNAFPDFDRGRGGELVSIFFQFERLQPALASGVRVVGHPDGLLHTLFSGPCAFADGHGSALPFPGERIVALYRRFIGPALQFPHVALKQINAINEIPLPAKRVLQTRNDLCVHRARVLLGGFLYLLSEPRREPQLELIYVRSILRHFFPICLSIYPLDSFHLTSIISSGYIHTHWIHRKQAKGKGNDAHSVDNVQLGSQRMAAMKQNTDPLDLIWGVGEIGKLIGRSYQQTYHMITTGKLPMVKQVGERYVASRAKLIAFFMEDAA